MASGSADVSNYLHLTKKKMTRSWISQSRAVLKGTLHKTYRSEAACKKINHLSSS